MRTEIANNRNHFFGGRHMLKNYLKIMLRNLINHRFYSALNIIGLAIGLACCILIGLYIDYELGFDQHQRNRDQIYRVIRETKTVDQAAFSERTLGGLVEVLNQDIYPEISEALRIHRWQRTIIADNKRIYKQAFCLTDENVLQVFDFPLIQGDPETVLSEPGSVLITQRLAHKLFGTENPIGKTILIEEDDKDYAHHVTGVLKNMPEQTAIRFDILSATKNGRWEEKWMAWKPRGGRPVESYILLKEGYDANQLEGKLSDLIPKYMGEAVANNIQYHLQPLNRIHLYSNHDYGIKIENRGTPETSKPHGDIQNVYLFSLLAIFILVIACVNFINLTTARAIGRRREVGLRKVVGANRLQLITQFLGESIFFACMALILALVLVELALPTFNSFFDRAITLNVNTTQLLLSLFGLIFIVGILAGSYPAFVLSTFRPVSMLRGKSATNVSTRLRKSLVVGQFALAILLMVVTWGVYSQQKFLRNKNLGFDREQIIEVPIFEAANSNQMINPTLFKSQYNAIKQAFTTHPNILKATTTRGPVGEGATVETFHPEGKSTYSMDVIIVDEDFLDFYGIKCVSGRNFTRSYAETTNPQRLREKLDEQFILNETAVEQLGWTNPIGKRFAWKVGGTFYPDGLRSGTVVGVVKDFHYKPLDEKIGRLVLVAEFHEARLLYLEVKSKDLSQTLAFVQKVWERYIPNRPFTFSFLDENLDRIYKNERKLSYIFGFFSTLGILIACLGLLGLATLSAQYRTKEIGIRKVLGASVSNIVMLLSSDFAKLVALANLLAWPIGYYALWQWLQNYAYRIDLGFEFFMLSGILAFLIAMITVSFQTMKAARSNPVDALRNE